MLRNTKRRLNGGEGNDLENLLYAISKPDYVLAKKIANELDDNLNDDNIRDSVSKISDFKIANDPGRKYLKLKITRLLTGSNKDKSNDNLELILKKIGSVFFPMDFNLSSTDNYHLGKLVGSSGDVGSNKTKKNNVGYDDTDEFS